MDGREVVAEVVGRVVPRPPLLVGTAEAAHLCGISPRLLWRLVREDKFPQPVRISECRRTLFRVRDLEEWTTRLPSRTETERALNAGQIEALEQGRREAAARKKESTKALDNHRGTVA
jgi:predicted DNA-binding transcriptional regulator AlpA